MGITKEQKKIRRENAEERQRYYDSLTIDQKIERAQKRSGEGKGASAKEILKLSQQKAEGGKSKAKQEKQTKEA